VIPHELAAFAEDPDLYIEGAEDGAIAREERFCLSISPSRAWGNVSRLRLRPEDVEETVAEIRGRTEGVGTVTWSVGSNATPADLPERLRGLGLGDPDPPLDPVVAALALAVEPPAVAGVEVRKVESFEDFLVGLEIMLGSTEWSEALAARERENAELNYERRRRRGGYEWLAFLDGEPVAHAAAARGSVGFYLAGGATLPHARGRGCYRALVRARWDEAMRLGLPGLVVHAQHGSSAPILRRLGFEDVATIHTLV
jgi:GNAT superfamily N-acetyltransferase